MRGIAWSCLPTVPRLAVGGIARKRVFAQAAVQGVGARWHRCALPMDPSAPLATAEFLVVDTETNGLGGDRCELTEIGAVLVGGGELHDRWDTLVAAPTPLSRGIQRFTGITQAMVDQAPRAEVVLPELARLLEGRVLVAHSASFDRRVLRQAFEREQLDWPAPPVLCTVALARRFAPLVRQRKLGALAASLGVEVRGPAPRAARRGDLRARVLRALLAAVRGGDDRRGGAGCDAPGAAAARARGRDRRRALAARRAQAPAGRQRAARRAGRLHLPQRLGPAAVRRQVGDAAHARAGALRAVVGVDRLGDAGRARRSSRDALGARRAAARAAADPRAAPAGQRAHQARRPLRLPALPASTSRSRCSRSRRSRRRATRSTSGRCAGATWRPSWSSSSTRCSGCATAGASCRGASTRRPTGRWAAACRRACRTSTRTSTARGSTRRWACSRRAATPRRALLAHVDEQMRAAAREQNFERAAWLRRRRARLAELLAQLDGVLAATHAQPRLVLAEHPRGGAWDAFWLVGGRVADWGPADRPRGRRRAARARRCARGDGTGRHDLAGAAGRRGHAHRQHLARITSSEPGAGAGACAGRRRATRLRRRTAARRPAR